MVAHVTRPGRIPFLTHRADHGHFPACACARLSRRGYERRQGTLGIHRAPPVQGIALALDGDIPRHGIDMPQQQDLIRPIPQAAHRVAGPVDFRLEPQGAHPAHQVAHRA